MLPNWDDEDEGWGEATAVVTPMVGIVVGRIELIEQEVDELDAMTMDGWVRQLYRPKRVVLVRRYVLRHKIDWQDLDPAVRALQDLMDQNRKTVDYIEGRLRG